MAAIIAKAGVALAVSVLCVNLVLYAIVLGLAGWAFNAIIDGTLHGLNPASPYLIIFAILAGVLGVTSILVSLRELLSQKGHYIGANSTGIVAWGMSLIILGLASKQIHVGSVQNKTLKALEAFAIIVSGTQFLYVVIAHLTLVDMSAPSTAPAEPPAKAATATV